MINIIGDPFLKSKIEMRFHNKLSSDDEITELENSIKKSQERIEYLKKQKSGEMNDKNNE